MLRLGGVVGILVAALGAPAFANDGVPLLVSGSPYSAIVDVNKNGQLGDDNDCMFMSYLTNGSALEIQATQPVTTTLRACAGPCFGDGFLSSDFGQVTMSSCEWRRPPGPPWVPAVVEFGPTVPSSSSPIATGAAQGAMNQPLAVQAGRLFYPLDPVEDPGFASLCDAGGPAVQVKLMGGAMVVREIKQLQPNGQAFACVNMPFEMEAGGFDFFDACVPTTPAGNIEVRPGGDTGPLAIARLVGLPSCGTTAAPAATGLGLILLAAALLGTGAWALGRRRSFVASLPLL